MVSIRKVHAEERPCFDEWLAQLSLSDSTKRKLAVISDNPDILLVGQEMVEILHQLHMDDATLQAALVYPYCQIHDLSNADVSEEFTPEIGHLIAGVRGMDAIKSLYIHQGPDTGRQSETHVDNIRRMLLSMVEDVRAVVIKLAERICRLRLVKDLDEENRVLVAKECATIYAPLANRLGIGQLKWELEDIAFRYLHPDTYKQIARMLDEKRTVRESYISDFVSHLQATLDKEGVKAKVYGRPKHIFSIWKKMQKKGLSFDQLYDIRAVRIITDRLQDCYGALGVVHALWKHIPREFDDYVATPKPNGYQSIHTVVLGPEAKTVEIQIRTQQMHQDAELGVAAHWKYKEGASGRSSYDERINWLRKILLWQEEVADTGDLVEELRSQVFDDRVYVFTPKGDVIDLPLGSTPLDFAYYVHTNVGHRCIGAKIGGRIVPFTYQLQSGDQVEILTGKNLNPSRDWMNPNFGYVFSSRARAKIHTYFRKQDRDKNLIAGKELLEGELSRANIPLKDAEKATKKFNHVSVDDLYAAIGGGDVRLMQVVNFLQQLHKPVSDFDPRLKQKSQRKPRGSKGHIEVEGVGNLLSQIAKCCQPLPGDPIIGYITMGKGVSVHRSDCEQLAHLLKQHPERHIDVHWSEQVSGAFTTKVELHCQDRDGILRDITTELANEKVTLLGVNSLSDTHQGTARISLTLEVRDLNTLSKTMTRLRRIKSVIDAKRLDQ